MLEHAATQVGLELLAHILGQRAVFGLKTREKVRPMRLQMRVDSKLQKGEKRQVQTAQPGYEVTVTRTVRENGEVILEDTFHSPYQPQQEIWAVGPGTPGAEEAEATGTP